MTELVGVVLMGALCLGCGGEREQALALLERVNAIDISMPPAQRMPQLTALESLRLADAALGQIQPLCAGAHRSLIDAEVEQAKARHALDTAEGGKTPQQRLAQAKEIALSIERSTRKLQQAQETFPECERQARTLALRFPKRSQ
jgi:hypothetical protein